jgi:hypothetical protein
MNSTYRLALAAIAVAVVMPAGKCSDSDDDAPLQTWVQVERLGRPAVNEGLILTNDFLNAFNSIPPSADLSPAASAVVNEAVGTLTALGNSAQRTNDIASAFLPDVMRIDTTLACPVGTGAYANGAQAVGALGVVRPVGGRKLEDDVIDITLSVLTNGGVTTDNVGYSGAGGNAAQPGHKLLSGQGAPLGAATFPFLAAPN